MAEFLVFTLAGPFVSFGTVAGNERRGSLDRPGHSMLAGLISAALGIKRSEADRLRTLSDARRFAVRTDKPGTLLVDYHTAQSAKRKRNFAPQTRKQMLAEGDITTIISRREYLMDVRFTVAVAVTGEHTTHSLQSALNAPVFTLYIGRKACPPALPLDPHVITALEIDESFAAYDQETRHRAAACWPGTSHPGDIALDARLKPEQTPGRRERRRARPVDRGTWRFDTLEELVLAPPVDAGTAPENGGDC